MDVSRAGLDLDRQKMLQSGSQFQQELAMKDRQFNQELGSRQFQFEQELGLKTRQIAAAAAESAAARAQERQAMELKKQMAQAELSNSAQELQIRRQSLEMEYEKAKMLSAMDAEKQNITIKQAQQQLMSTSQYQQMVEGGMDPSEAMLRVGPSLGDGYSLSAAFRDQEEKRQAKLPPEFFTAPEGEQFVRVGGGNPVQVKKATIPKDEAIKEKKMILDNNQKLLAVTAKELMSLRLAIPNQENLNQLKVKTKEYKDTRDLIERLTDELQGKSSAESSAPAGAVKIGKYQVWAEED